MGKNVKKGRQTGKSDVLEATWRKCFKVERHVTNRLNYLKTDHGLSNMEVFSDVDKSNFFVGIGVKALLGWVQERLGRNKEGTEDWLYRL